MCGDTNCVLKETEAVDEDGLHVLRLLAAIFFGCCLTEYCCSVVLLLLLLCGW